MDVLFGTSAIGLGHAARDAALAAHLQSTRGWRVRFVTGGAAVRFLRDHGFQVRDLYQPPRWDIAEGGHVRGTAMWFLRYLAYHRRCLRALLRSLPMDGVGLVVGDEDFAVVDAARRRGVPAAFVTDVLSIHAVGGPIAGAVEKVLNLQMRKFLDSCELVIVPEEGLNEGNLLHVGPIVRPLSAPREVLRETFGFRRATVLVAGGGTDAGAFLFQRVAQEASRWRDRADIVVVTGPAPSPMALNGVRVFGFVPNLHEAIAAADVLVTLAGKSTIDEALAAGTPVVAIPLKDHWEQEENAAMLGYRHDDIGRLGDLVDERLAAGRSPPQPQGLERAAAALEAFAARRGRQ